MTHRTGSSLLSMFAVPGCVLLAAAVGCKPGGSGGSSGVPSVAEPFADDEFWVLRSLYEDDGENTVDLVVYGFGDRIEWVSIDPEGLDIGDGSPYGLQTEDGHTVYRPGGTVSFDGTTLEVATEFSSEWNGRDFSIELACTVGPSLAEYRLWFPVTAQGTVSIDDTDVPIGELILQRSDACAAGRALVEGEAWVLETFPEQPSAAIAEDAVLAWSPQLFGDLSISLFSRTDGTLSGDIALPRESPESEELGAFFIQPGNTEPEDEVATVTVSFDGDALVADVEFALTDDAGEPTGEVVTLDFSGSATHCWETGPDRPYEGTLLGSPYRGIRAEGTGTYSTPDGEGEFSVVYLMYASP